MTLSRSGDGQSGSARAHFVLVPMMAQGHTIPMTDMARLLAEHGAQVRFITTPVNAARLEGFAADVKAAGLAGQLVELHFPSVEFGLPDGCENLDMIQSKNLFLNFMKACAALHEPLMAYLREQQHSPPSCIISDMAHWWTGDIARELGIPRLTFSGFCGFSSLVRYIIFHNNVLEHVTDDNELITIPGFPTPLELTKAKLPGGTLCVPGMEQIREKMFEEELRCDGEITNSFKELETLYIESYEQITRKKVWTIGPMCLCHRNSNRTAARGNKASMDEAQCLQWLDSRKPGSVIFVSFGSLACTTPQQLVELGLGLEASKKPFVWVIKAGAKLPEVEEWLADGFEERVRDRGVPMITWPHFAEQFLNEKLVVDVLKLGVEVGVQGVTHWVTEQQEVMVTRDAVETAVNTLMGEGEATEELRMRAKDCAIKARRAFDEEGSSYNNFIRSVCMKQNENKEPRSYLFASGSHCVD
uniref:Cytokinin-O-glucosyltransferase 1 n=1 Tax=Aegilops tauschii TaxID=37682 RepID=N1QUW1_AEGTA